MAFIIVAFADGFRMGRHGHLCSDATGDPTIFAGLWFFECLFCVPRDQDGPRSRPCLERGSDESFAQKPRGLRGRQAPSSLPTAAATRPPASEIVADPSRRYFFRTATALAGAAPFLSAVYGFAAERLNYQVHRVEIPMANLPPALDGMQIAQISDIHLSDYMTPSDVRRAVEMTNELGAAYRGGHGRLHYPRERPNRRLRR